MLPLRASCAHRRMTPSKRRRAPQRLRSRCRASRPRAPRSRRTARRPPTARHRTTQSLELPSSSTCAASCTSSSTSRHLEHRSHRYLEQRCSTRSRRSTSQSSDRKSALCSIASANGRATFACGSSSHVKRTCTSATLDWPTILTRLACYHSRLSPGDIVTIAQELVARFEEHLRHRSQSQEISVCVSAPGFLNFRISNEHQHQQQRQPSRRQTPASITREPRRPRELSVCLLARVLLLCILVLAAHLPRPPPDYHGEPDIHVREARPLGAVLVGDSRAATYRRIASTARVLQLLLSIAYCSTSQSQLLELALIREMNGSLTRPTTEIRGTRMLRVWHVSSHVPPRWRVDCRRAGHDSPELLGVRICHVGCVRPCVHSP